MNTRTAFKIVAAVVLSLLGMALLPFLALPYGNLDWIAYEPAYQQGYTFPPTTQPPPKPTPRIPCAGQPGPDEPLAARINGQGIGMEAFEREMAQFLAALVTAGTDLQAEDVQEGMPEYRRQVLDRLIDAALVQQAAVELGLTITDEEIQGRASREISQNGGLDWFEERPQETGQTWQDYQSDIYQDQLRLAILDKVTAGITGTVEMVWARQIVVASREDAWEVLARLASGENLAAVARELSLDGWTRDQGGDLGWLPRGLGWITPQVEEAAFAGQPGQIQGPIQAGDLHVIIQTLDHRSDLPLDPDMRKALRAIAFEQWLAGCRKAAEVEILIDLNAPAP
jgi:parvulin-like peptidyl-prolyl isomerase